VENRDEQILMVPEILEEDESKFVVEYKKSLLHDGIRLY